MLHSSICQESGIVVCFSQTTSLLSLGLQIPWCTAKRSSSASHFRCSRRSTLEKRIAFKHTICNAIARCSLQPPCCHLKSAPIALVRAFLQRRIRAVCVCVHCCKSLKLTPRCEAIFEKRNRQSATVNTVQQAAYCRQPAADCTAARPCPEARDPRN